MGWCHFTSKDCSIVKILSSKAFRKAYSGNNLFIVTDNFELNTF